MKLKHFQSLLSNFLSKYTILNQQEIKYIVLFVSSYSLISPDIREKAEDILLEAALKIRDLLIPETNIQN